MKGSFCPSYPPREKAKGLAVPHAPSSVGVPVHGAFSLSMNVHAQNIETQKNLPESFDNEIMKKL